MRFSRSFRRLLVDDDLILDAHSDLRIIRERNENVIAIVLNSLRIRKCLLDLGFDLIEGTLNFCLVLFDGTIIFALDFNSLIIEDYEAPTVIPTVIRDAFDAMFVQCFRGGFVVAQFIAYIRINRCTGFI